MHEFAVASQVLETARELALDRGGVRIERLRLSVGEASHLNVDQLRTCLRAASADTMAADADLELETEPPYAECDCGWSGEPEVLDAALAYAPDLQCPDCDARLDLERGDGCYLLQVEVATGEDGDAVAGDVEATDPDAVATDGVDPGGDASTGPGTAERRTTTTRSPSTETDQP